MNPYDRLRTRNGSRGAAHATRAGIRHVDRFLLALAFAGCLPLDDLSPGDEHVPPAQLDAGAPRGLPEGCVERSEPHAGLGSCYAIAREPAIWGEALARCEGWGGSLVSINSASESDWLAATVDVSKGKSKRLRAMGTSRSDVI